MAKSRKKDVATTSPAAEPETITTYKGFNRDLTCRGFQFEVGKTYTISGKVEACSNGFHACESPLNVFDYYPPGESRYFEVRQGGDLSRHDADTKVASATITLGIELSLGDMVARAIKWVTERATETGKHVTGYRSAASATGYRSAASATGDQSAASATGDQSAASATGSRSAASATGYRSAASATGYQSAASATGDQSAASATGYQSAASATGDQSAASATGDQSAASATGYRCAASATGGHAVASGIGILTSACADETGAIFLVNRDEYTGAIRHVFASKVGENGIKANVAYRLSDDGKPEEVAP